MVNPRFLFRLIESDEGTKRGCQRALVRVDRTIKREFPQAIDEYWYRVLVSAKRNCPIGTPATTGIKGYIGGSLQNTIEIVESPPAGAVFEVVKAPEAQVISKFIKAGSDTYINPNTGQVVDYAQAVHDGTFRMPPRPFLTMALAENQAFLDGVLNKMLNKMGKAWEMN